MSHTSLLHVGTIIGAHGIKGEVKIKSFIDDAAELTRHGALLDQQGSPLFSVRVRSTNKDALIAALEGIKDRNEAEKLKGKKLYLSKDALPALKENEYYHQDLEGMEVHDMSGQKIGTVSGIYNFGAGDILEIKRDDTQKSEMFSFVSANFPSIDNIKRTITFSPPEELIGGGAEDHDE